MSTSSVKPLNSPFQFSFWTIHFCFCIYVNLTSFLSPAPFLAAHSQVVALNAHPTKHTASISAQIKQFEFFTIISTVSKENVAKLLSCTDIQRPEHLPGGEKCSLCWGSFDALWSYPSRVHWSVSRSNVMRGGKQRKWWGRIGGYFSSSVLMLPTCHRTSRTDGTREVCRSCLCGPVLMTLSEENGPCPWCCWYILYNNYSETSSVI